MMDRDKSVRKAYNSANKKVRELKRFYNHLALYIPASLLTLLAAPFIVAMLRAQGAENPDILHWVRLNILLLPLIWLPVLVIHGLQAFWHRLGPWFKGLKPGFLKRWEERQMRKYLDESDHQSFNGSQR